MVFSPYWHELEIGALESDSDEDGGFFGFGAAQRYQDDLNANASLSFYAIRENVLIQALRKEAEKG